MTKKLKILAFALIAVLTCVGFASCSDDDKDEPTANHALIGTWIESWYHDIIELKADGSGYIAESLEDTKEPFTWTYKDDVFVAVGKFGETEIARLVSQSENTIVWRHYVNNPDAYGSGKIYEDGYGYYYIWTWTRYTK